ncbi:MAG: hypothetical protein PUB18_02045 [bacterium]|nr:hypothetical protein [bacterium]
MNPNTTNNIEKQKRLEENLSFLESVKILEKKQLEYEKICKERIEILNELDQKGVLDLYIARKRDDASYRKLINSIKDHKTIIREASKIIASAYKCDFSNPKEVKKWLEKLTPYINDYEINSGIIDIDKTLKSPIDLILNELAQQNYNFEQRTSNQKKDDEHNRIVNAYKRIEDPQFLNLSIEEINSNLEIIFPYIRQELRINAEELKEKTEEYNSNVLPIVNQMKTEGLMNTILSILEKNGYNQEEEFLVKYDGINEYIGCLTEEEYNKNHYLEHNIVHTMYLDLLHFGMLSRNLKKDMDNYNQELEQTLNSKKIQLFLEKINMKIQDASASPESPKKKYTTKEEQKINNIMKELNNCATYSALGSAMEKLTKYINDPQKTIILSNGKHIIEEIFAQATLIGYDDSMDIRLIVENNPLENIEAITNCIKNLKELKKYNCFISEKCREVLKQKKLEKTTKTSPDTLDKIVTICHQVMTEGWNQYEQKLTEIDKKIMILNEQLIKIENDRIRYANTISLIENITNSEVKYNASFDELILNSITQKQKERQKLNQKSNQLQKKKELTGKKVLEEFSQLYLTHASDLKKYEKEQPENEEELIKLQNRLVMYQQIKNLFVANEDIKRKAIQIDKERRSLKLSDIKSLIETQEDIVARMKDTIDNMDRKILEERDYAMFQQLYELSLLSIEIQKTEYQKQGINAEIKELETYKLPTPEEITTIKEKIKELKKEEIILTKNPELIAQEIRELINSNSRQEAIGEKLDQLINPIIEFYKPQKARLKYEMDQLKTKIDNIPNYIDENKVSLKREEKENIEQEITRKDDKIIELQDRINKREEEYQFLANYIVILTEQLKNYQEEKQILLTWGSEESHSSIEVQKVLTELFNQNKSNMTRINQELSSYNAKLEKLKQEITQEIELDLIKIEQLKEERKNLINQAQTIANMLEDGTAPQLIDTNKKLDDLKELLKKKEKLKELESIETLKQSYMDEIANKKVMEQVHHNSALSEVLENESRVLSNSKIEVLDTKEIELLKEPLSSPNHVPLNNNLNALPGVLESGAQILSNGQIIEKSELRAVTTPKRSLVSKAKQLVAKKGKAIFDYLKKHPLKGGAVLAMIVGGVITVTSIFGGTKSPTKTPPKNQNIFITQTTDNGYVEHLDQITEEIDSTAKISFNQEVIERKEDIELPTYQFEQEYQQAIDNIINKEENIYTSAYDAIYEQNAVGADKLYMNAFENAELGTIYKIENDQLIKIDMEEAASIVENGGRVSVAVENEKHRIGFITIGEENTNQKSGISR